MTKTNTNIENKKPMSEIAIFQAYDYFNTTAAQRSLTPSEDAFRHFCMDHHYEVCNCKMDNEMAQKASALYGYCMDHCDEEKAEMDKAQEC